jgi:ubiquinone/menaquinone biosynthesis C-methylase UbiE
MAKDRKIDEHFADRFRTMQQVEHYRDRYAGGRRARVHHREVASLRSLLARVGPLDSALDMPCGTGRLSSVLAQFAGGIILADQSFNMLSVARKDCPGVNAQFLQIRAEQISLQNGTVDIVFCHRLLNHVFDLSLRARIMSEIARVSRRYVVLSFFPSSFRTRLRLWLRELMGIDRNQAGPASQQTFLSEARSAGLRPIHSTTIRRFPLAFFCLFEKTGKGHSTF